MKKLLEKVPIIKYVLRAFIKYFVVSIVLSGMLFVVLTLTGIYPKLENALDLKYNSPFLLIPLSVFGVLSLLCFFVGFLLYFHKYKRPKTKSRFQKNLLDRLNSKQEKIIAIMLCLLVLAISFLPETSLSVSAATVSHSGIDDVSAGEDDLSANSVSTGDGRHTPVEGTDFTINIPNGEYGWYKAGDFLEITPIGMYTQIREGEEGEWKDELIKSEETSAEGNAVTFFLRNSETGEISNPQTIDYKLDHTPPYACNAVPKTVYVAEDWDVLGVFGQYEWEREYLGNINGQGMENINNFLYHVILTAKDDLSGVSYFRWKYKSDGNWSEPISAINGTAQIGVNYSQWHTSGGIDVTVCDMAGNICGEEGFLSHNSLWIVYSDEHLQRCVNTENVDISESEINGGARLIYNQETTVTLTAWANNFDEKAIVVSVNDEPVTVNWVKSGLEYTGTIMLLEGSSRVKVSAVGYDILSNETGCKVVSEEYFSNLHIVDTTNPIISVVFEPETGEENRYGSDRKMTVSIEDQNFRASELYFSSFSAKDIQGNDIKGFSADDFLDKLKKAAWKTEGDIHSATVVFSTDAYYDFVLEYSDMANNPAISYDADSFSVDKTAPENLKIVYVTNPINILLNVISLGYYNPSVTIQIYAEDTVSGIERFNWIYKQQDGTSTTHNIDVEKGQIDCTDSEKFTYLDNGKTAMATFTLTANEVVQYRGSISFTATDKMGHTSESLPPEYIIVVDTIAPICEVTYPEPQKTGVGENDTPIIYYDNTYGSIVPVTLKITEANFCADDVEIKVNGTDYAIDNWSQEGDDWTGKINLTQDGTYVITISYVDRSGNEMQPYQSGKIVIDRVKPVIDKFEFMPTTADGDVAATTFIEVLEYGYYFKTDFAIKIYTSDLAPSSGLDKVIYRLVSYEDGIKQGETSDTIEIVDGVAELTVPAGFKGQIFAESYDNVGNKSDEVTPKAFVVDKTPPFIEVGNSNTTSLKDADGNYLYVTDTSVVVTITDNLSGIKEIGYVQTSENGTYARKSIMLENTGYKVGDNLGDGWIVLEMDVNLVTRVSKTFSFDEDDNNIILTFDAMDRSGNKIENVSSNRFTIDKTPPVINVDFRPDDDTDLYYQEDRIAEITVIERNFNAALINIAIENRFGDVPEVVFMEISNIEHVAVIHFDEGDYIFEASGTDLGNHSATVNYSGGNEQLFYVDKTSPVVTNNFADFSNIITEDSFNMDKTVSISITEHNFDSDLVNLHIFQKNAGTDHSNGGFTDITEKLIGNEKWSSNEDIHTITFTVSEDAVYQIEMNPIDLANNAAGYSSTVVFEIDKTVPVVSARNGKPVGENDVLFLDIYTYERKEESSPTVEFSDLNIDHIRYSLTVWVPDYSYEEAVPMVKPIRVYLKEDTENSGVIDGGKFTLPDFMKDGVYALELVAVDIAGNESTINVNTYARMIEQDVLAFILNSNLENKTGLYSFQYENGIPISMRPDNFSPLDIFVLAKEDTSVDIVLRDTNAEEIHVDAQVKTDDRIYGFIIYNYRLQADFFEDNFSNDMDTDLNLTVKNDDRRIDLGKMHIDNMAPKCELPESLSSWHWYFGEETRIVDISDINESLDEDNCKVYDNGKEIDFVYSSEDNTITFTLIKGWHNVGIVLTDMAGNVNYIQEKTNICVGYFWLWIIVAGLCLIICVTIVVFIRQRRENKKNI